MAQIKLKDAAGATLGELELADAIFAAPVRADLVHAAVVAQLAAKRTGTHSTLDRGQVSGGGRKPYRQKGTGRARQGSIRAPQWTGGGVIFGPTPRSYAQKLPRKVRQAALRSAWSDHVASGTLLAVEDWGVAEPKTRLMAATLRELLRETAEAVAEAMPAAAERAEGDTRPQRRARRRQHVLLLLGPDDLELKRAVANLDELRFDLGEKKTVIYAVQANTAPYASVYDLVWADVVVASANALARVSAEYGAQEEEA